MMNYKKISLALSLVLSGMAAQAQDQGLTGEYFNGSKFNNLVMTRSDKQINFYWDNVAPAAGINPGDFSVRWTGKIKAPESGKYMFRAKVDDGIRVKINGQSVIDAWGMNDAGKFIGYITLNAGQLYDLQVEYFNGLLEGEIQLFWQLPSEEPVFGGTFGYNDHVIESKYYFKKEAPPATPAKPATPPKKTTTKPEPTKKPKDTKPKPAPKTPEKAPAPVVKAPTPVTKDSIEHFIPRNILFERSKNAMLPGSLPELDRLAGFLNRHPQLKLTIEGHTDNLGDPENNLKLSQMRADRVAAYLASKGVAANRVKAVGYGDTRPLIVSEKGNPKNRRVVFLIE